ncbi:MAG: S49 family peptidase [Pseudomonadota bacterium]
MTLRKRLRRLLRRTPRVNVLRLYGAIGLPGRGPGLSDAGMASAIEAAFAGKPAAVALAVNSPGGSPVQSALIAARIRRLAEEKKVPVIAFCEDVAASGGYWLACAAEEIFADASSVVGSIGVIYAGFGAHELLQRNGIERRVHTAGERKLILDPFQPEREEDVAVLRDLQDEVHAAFIDHVKARRGDRLSAEETLFDGSIRVGARAQAAGLIDGLGHLIPTLKARFGEETTFRDFGPRRSLAQRFGLASLAAEATQGALDTAEARAAWARFGA